MQMNMKLDEEPKTTIMSTF